jgi:hypothetical protein
VCPPPDDYVDVPGDCIHMPGNEHAKRGCLLCNPRPTVSEAPPTSLRMGASRAADGWVHAECVVSDRVPTTEAQFDGRCKACNESIDIGDRIAPNV